MSGVAEKSNHEMKTEGIKLKGCPKCGAKFKCEGEDCWCHNYQILNKNVHYIRLTWDDCLCPDCLKEFAENKEQL
jgi:hypothetical protein